MCLPAAHAAAAEFGHRGGPSPGNVGEIAGILREDPYDLELLIGFGPSKGGSAGRLALAVRDGAPGDDLVHSANCYADRHDRHAAGFCTDELMVRILKKEYLFGTSSTVSARRRSGWTSARSTSARWSASASTAFPRPRRKRWPPASRASTATFVRGRATPNTAAAK